MINLLILINIDYVYYIWRLPQKAIQILQQVISGNLQIFKLIPLLLPYLVILATFGSFVLWNGGVVLGIYSLTSTLQFILIMSR